MNVGGIPVGGMVTKMSDDNIMIVGDAASQLSPLTGGGLSAGMAGGMFAGDTAAEAIKENDFSAKKLSEYDKKAEEHMGEKMARYLKVRNYLTSLSDDELNSIASSFQNVEFEEVSTTELIKKLIKVSPKALLKLGKIV